MSAPQKLCPLSFNVQPAKPDLTTDWREGGPWKCMGNACMAYREEVTARIKLRPGARDDLPFADGWRIARSHNPDSQTDALVEWEKVGKAYCGLAGRPQ